MTLTRRRFLAAPLTIAPWAITSGQTIPLDFVAVYVIPLDDFPEDLASSLARYLQEQFGFRIKASLRLPPLALSPIAGTNQYAIEDIFDKGLSASRFLPETSPGTYRLFLTVRDINNRTANFRFQFSAHEKSRNCSVVSLARLLEYPDEKPAFTNLAAVRLVKMTQRAIGEMRLGWSRSPDPTNLMYAPIMSLDDIDRIGNALSPPAAPVGPKE